MRTIILSLSKVIPAQDYHKYIEEGHPYDLEVFAETDLNIKIPLKDRNPPCTINIHYQGRKDLIVFVSKKDKEPAEGKNQGKHLNPTRIVI